MPANGGKRPRREPLLPQVRRARITRPPVLIFGMRMERRPQILDSLPGLIGGQLQNANLGPEADQEAPPVIVHIPSAPHARAIAATSSSQPRSGHSAAHTPRKSSAG